jgi:hypothetical protein
MPVTNTGTGHIAGRPGINYLNPSSKESDCTFRATRICGVAFPSTLRFVFDRRALSNSTSRCL